MLYYNTLKLLILLLVSLATCSPVSLSRRGQSVIIGYRRTNKEQAQRYNDAQTITDEANLNGIQTGVGAYTAYKKDLWPGNPTDWHCVIFADPDAMKRVSKAWIPEKDGDTQLWWQNDDVLGVYIHYLDDTWDPAKTLRLSIISGMGWNDVQMSIPPGLLNSNNGGLSIYTYCEEKIEKIPSYEVNYDDWQDNIKGTRENPH